MVESNHRDIKNILGKKLPLIETMKLLKGQLDRDYGIYFDNETYDVKEQPNLRSIKFLRAMEQLDNRNKSTFIQGRFDKYNHYKHRATARGLKYINIIDKSTNNHLKKIARVPTFRTSTIGQNIANVIYHGRIKIMILNHKYLKLVIMAIEYNRNKQQITSLLKLGQDVISNSTEISVDTDKINALETFILERKDYKFYNEQVSKYLVMIHL